MAWLEYLIPLIFLFPLAATAVIVVGLRNLHDARVSSPFDAHPLREPASRCATASTAPSPGCSSTARWGRS